MQHPAPNLQRIDRGLSIVAAVAVWAFMLAVIGIEASVAVPAVTHERIDSVTRTCDTIGMVGVAYLAVHTLIVEWNERYNRRRSLQWRFYGWLAQGFLFLIYAASCITEHHIAALIFVASNGVAGVIGWHAWMRSQYLHPDDQKVLDELINAQEQRAAEDHERWLQQRRALQFQRAASRFTSTPPPVPAAKAPAAARFAWPIPEGKHKPLVYFVQNGNRVKIGTTSNLRNRISNLSLRPADIVLLLNGNRTVEQALHRRFADLRVGNTEWFQNAGPLAQFIEIETAKARAAAKTEA